MKIIKVLVLVIIAGTLLLGYLGVIPVVSAVLGSDKPRDLGKTFSQKTYDDTYQKCQTEELPLEDAGYAYSVKYEGSHPADLTFTDDELTAMVNRTHYRDYPIKSAQIRINPDGSVESSGISSTPKVIEYLVSMGVPLNDIKKAMDKYPIPRHELPFYLKGRLSVQDNQISITSEKVEFGRIPVPQSIVSQYEKPLADLIETKLKEVGPEIVIDQVTIDNGQLHYQGTLPDKEYTTR